MTVCRHATSKIESASICFPSIQWVSEVKHLLQSHRFQDLR